MSKQETTPMKLTIKKSLKPAPETLRCYTCEGLRCDVCSYLGSLR